MDRKIVATGLLLTGLLVAMPALAQDFIPEDIQWTSARPDRNLSTTMGHSTGLIREQCPVW